MATGIGSYLFRNCTNCSVSTAPNTRGKALVTVIIYIVVRNCIGIIYYVLCGMHAVILLIVLFDD